MRYDVMWPSMSWQRILEVARRRGMPMIVTDIAGREPMVLLPFEQYERLDESVSTDQRGVIVNMVIPPITEPVVTEAAIDRMTEQGVAARLQRKDAVAAVESAGDTATDEALDVEERFYLEPIEETQK